MSEQNITKAERKRLKKEKKMQEREQIRSQFEKKKKMKSIRNYSILFLLLVGIAAFFYIKSIPPENAPIIRINPSTYDFGIVSQAEGTVSTIVSIYNNGNEDLILNDMSTSCACTSASIVYNGVEGPEFGMASHGTNPKGWSVIIPPGDSAQLKISYDPNVHKELRGAVSRIVFIESNDPMHGTKEVRINVVQTN